MMGEEKAIPAGIAKQLSKELYNQPQESIPAVHTREWVQQSRLGK